jgi:hypothetical protein
MSKPNGMGSHQSAASLTTTWMTPPAVLAALGPFDLDPCSPAIPPWKIADLFYTEEDDGLVQPWHGFVWMNPPYGAETGRWLRKLAEHGNGLALIFARTETADFVEQVWGKADAVMFLHGRLYFHHVTGERARANGGAPSCLVAYGTEAVSRLERCGLAGTIVTNWRRGVFG